MKKFALITGASSGIGLELAREIAADGYGLVLVARSEEKLMELKDLLLADFGVEVFVIVQDLSLPDSAEKIFDEVSKIFEVDEHSENEKSQEFEVDENTKVLEILGGIKKSKILEILVNNAGFGDFGEFKDGDLEKYEAMINLNILTLTKLTKLFLPGMLEQVNQRNLGSENYKESKFSPKILNVASMAGFLPGPLMAVYYATKAYVLSFSEGLAEELRHFAIEDSKDSQGSLSSKKSKISVTALCPGATKSGFQKEAEMSNSGLVKGKSLMTSAEVAKYGYKALKSGKVVAVPGLANKLLLFSRRLMPRFLLRRVVAWMSREK